MPLTPPETPTPAPSDEAVPPDIARLFRRQIVACRVHPLMPLLMRYRRAVAGSPGPEEGRR